MYKTAVIGNGPAGMCAAHQLRHRDVVVVAPGETPSPSTCGGVLTAPAINHLKNQNLFEAIIPDGGRRLTSLAVAHRGQILIQQNLDPHEMVSVRRDRFDRMLYDELGLESINRITDYVQGVKQDNNSIQLNLRNGDPLRTEGIIDASGHRRVTGSGSDRPDKPLIGIEWHLDHPLPEPDQLLLVLGDGCYAGLTTTPDNQTTVSAIFRPKPDQTRQFDERWNDVRVECPSTIQNDLPEQAPDNPKTKAGFWRAQAAGSISKRVVRAGDALGFTMPLSGEGIAMAMREGTIAGQTLKNEHTNQTGVFPLSRKIQRRLFNQMVLPYRDQRPRWKRTHWLGMNGPFVSFAGNVFPGLLNWILRKHIPSEDHWSPS